MKKLKLLIFLFVINSLFILSVSAQNFTCVVDNYNIEYNSSGEIVSVKKADGTTINKYLSSYFKPKSKSECPKESEAKTAIIDGGRTFYVAKESETFGSSTTTTESAASCVQYKFESECTNSKDFACVWNETKYGNYCNVDNLLYVACGDIKDIPYQVPGLISFLVNLLKIATPIILIIVSIVSLLKALAATNEDEIKKAQKSLIRKIVAAVLVFFVISIVQFVIFIVADDTTGSNYNNLTEVDNLSDCLNCFLNNDCEENIYYRNNIGGQYYYYNVKSGSQVSFDDEYSVKTNYYSGHKNTDCESYGYFGEADGYKDSYHPKAVKVNGTCYTLTDTGNKIKNYTNYLTGEGKIHNQTLYSANGTCYYWEGRINNYIQTSCDTEMVSAFYNGAKPDSCNGQYFNYSNTNKEGYQPKSISIDGTCYGLSKTEFKYANRTTNLFGESNIITQSVWKANGKCYYWEGRQMSYIEIECKDHY